MAGLAVIPTWVVPCNQQVLDAHRLAYAVAIQSGSQRMLARVDALDWVTKGGRAPVTNRDDPPTKDRVQDEFIAADMARMRADTPVSRERTTGLSDVLGWLVGMRRDPGMRLPVRHPDGTVLTAAELVERARAENPHAWWGPEARHAARIQADCDADLYRRLAALADSV